VTVIEHFRICQVNQISLSQIINAADNSNGVASLDQIIAHVAFEL